jgi:uncharacterized protein YbjT (DUF2867 family)
MRILIIGVSGNIGQAILRHFDTASGHTLFLASRNKADSQPGAYNQYVYFDFDDLPKSYPSLLQTDVLFLLRPPHISDVTTYFKPLIELCKKANIKHIVFLSVQGADKASFIPHAKIEKLILKSGIAYTFVRPGYFMQNLSTTLQEDICRKNRIYLPAGHATFNWIDVDDIGLAIARILENIGLHTNKIYTITGSQNLSFQQAASYLTDTLHRKIQYISLNVVRFYYTKRKEGVATEFILVMILLHFLPRFQAEPLIYPDFELLIGRKPTTLQTFIATHKQYWQTKNPAQE